ncbi:hypothetical protein NXS19_002202 [Fusarium pseudograminearum]|nr:hypothetical protein NXS19_002202 [Fusarium pseudograminearum]
MASPYDEFCGRISSEFNREFDNQDKESRFAGLGMIKTVLPQPELDKFYNILKDEQVERPDDAQAFKQIIERRMLYEFLAAMLCAQCSFEAAKAFVDKMVLGNLAKIQEKRAEKPYYLPQSERDLETLFGNFTDARKFLSVQKLFCVIVFGSVDVVTIKTDEMKSLPWTVNKKINSGTYGRVEEVTISSDHLTTNGDFNNVNSMAVQLARKSFVEAPNPRKNFNQELQTIRKILRSSSKSDNILTSLAAIVVEETKDTNFYLLMPLALCDLKQYMETDRQMDVKFKARLIGSAMGLANGLSFLHKNIHSDEGDHICYHLDLRPANVLLFKDQHSSYADEMVWKLSDFGISKVKTVHEPGKKPKNSGTEESRLLKDLFRTQESDSGEGVASDTKNVRGRSTFSPLRLRILSLK